MQRVRTGTIYEEWTFTRYRRGVGMIKKRRWVGEICINYKRYRCRSSRKENVEWWLRDMIEKAPPITRGHYTPEKLAAKKVYYKKHLGITIN